MPTTKPFKHQTKTQALTQHLAEMAAQLGPLARMPTMQQMCQSMDVSVVTLNRALSELEAQNIITRKHGVGIFVSSRINRKTIGLVYDHDIFQAGASPFGGLLMHAAQQRAASGSEQFSFYLAIPSKEGLPVHDDLVEDLRARRLHGLLFASEGNPAAAQWLLRQDVPLVALAYNPIAPYRVRIDHAAGVRLGVQALAQQGCRRVGLWIPVGSGIGRGVEATSFEELDAFAAALKKHRLPFHRDLVWRLDDLTDQPAAQPHDSKQDQGAAAAAAVFSARRSERPDGIVIMDDMMARGALVTLNRKGIRLGQDLRVASHTNRGSQVLHGYESQLTVIEVDPAKIVQAMFEMLETLMRGRQPARHVVAIQPKLTVAVQP